MCELYGWFERSSKRGLKVNNLKSILRIARRRFIKKHGTIPNLLTVRKDEYQDWMGNMGISIKQVDGNLVPKHFTLEFVGGLNEQSPDIN